MIKAPRPTREKATHPLTEFLTVLRENGMPGLVSRLERGTI